MKPLYYRHLMTLPFAFLILLNGTLSANAEGYHKEIDYLTRFNINNQFSTIENTTVNISDKIGDCTLCDQISIFDNIVESQLDLFNASSLPAQTSIIESVVETISNKIG